MSDCRHILFVKAADKDAAFKLISQASIAVPVKPGIVKIIDPTSREADNFVTNKNDRLEIDIQVKTAFISDFFYEIFTGFSCSMKDCEDSEDDPSEPITSFFRANS